MSACDFPERIPQGRNLVIFWGATLEGKSQSALASEHGISQQRVSQIVRSVRQFVALASSEAYDGVPQPAQLQLGCRVQIEKLRRRRREVADAWRKSTEPKISVKRASGPRGERVETLEKSQHGDWRLDRQLGQIDQQILDTTLLLYERPWFGREERLRNAAGMRKVDGMRNAELGMRNEESVAAACEEAGSDVVVVDGAAEAVLGIEDSVLGMEQLVEAERVTEAESGEMDDLTEPTPAPPTPPAAHSAFPISNSAFAEASAIEPELSPATSNPAGSQLILRPAPLCDLTGRRISGPSDRHRPWRTIKVSKAWLLAHPTGTGYTPEGVLWKLEPPRAEPRPADDEQFDRSRDSRMPWDTEFTPSEESFSDSELVAMT